MSTIGTLAEKTSFSMDEFCDALRRSELVDEAEIRIWRGRGSRGVDARVIAAQMIKAGLLTRFQANRLLEGKSRGFVIGPYRILDLLTEGNKDAIYLAEHRAMNRHVAIKVLKQNVDQIAGNRERFMREARITASLDHPNIVKLFDFVDEKGQQYLVMEYATGKTLKQIVAEEGPLPISQALEFARQIASGLQHAHVQGIIHRDIKPSSMIVDAKGVVKILDMGHCRFSDDQQMNITKMYDPTKVVGSIDYIAPEQAIGEQYDARCDLYSLGATLFTLITGQPPFKGTSYQILMAHQMDDVPDMKAYQPKVTSAIQALVVKMMAKIPQQRYQTADEVIKAIQRLQGTVTRTKVPPLPQRDMPTKPRSTITLDNISLELSIPSPAPSPVALAPVPLAKSVPRRKPIKRSSTKWIITSGVLALILIGIVVYWLISKAESGT